MKICVIVNADGGTIQRGGFDAERERLSAALAKCDFAAEVIFSTGADLRRNAERMLKEAAAKWIDAVVVGGGDGSVSTVADVLVGTGVPLGILPLGTLNHFAKDLGLPLEVEGAAQVI